MKKLHSNYKSISMEQVRRIEKILVSKGFIQYEAFQDLCLVYRGAKFSVIFSQESIMVYKDMRFSKPEPEETTQFDQATMEPVSFPEETLEWFSFDTPISLKRAIAGSLICDHFEVEYAGVTGEFRTSGKFFQVYRSGKYCEWLPIATHQVVVKETGTGDAIWVVSSIAQYSGPILEQQ